MHTQYITFFSDNEQVLKNEISRGLTIKTKSFRTKNRFFLQQYDEINGQKVGYCETTIRSDTILFAFTESSIVTNTLIKLSKLQLTEAHQKQNDFASFINIMN